MANGKEEMIGEIFKKLSEMREDLESETLTMASKDPEHIFADAEVVGKTTEGRFLRETIVELSDERKRFQTKAEEDRVGIARLEERYEDVLKELAASTEREKQLSARYEETARLLAVSEEERSQEQADLEELKQWKKRVGDQWKLIENLKTAIITVQEERDQFRQCVNTIRTRLGSVAKDSVKGKLEEFVSHAREAISEVSV
ncbi:MAG: hypothetical protein U9M90_00915 [Patescibacteria group bacterium]|nr:hypothetical protein [Patescibacteria group bacterium]